MLSKHISVCILDYGAGNVLSVYNAVKSISPKVVISNEIGEIRKASHLILPGVGAFGSSMKKIREKLPLDFLLDQIKEVSKPFLGICVGMQVLTDYGLEFGKYDGLSLIPGYVEKIRCGELVLPHVGWNNIHTINPSLILKDLDTNSFFYFVHSFSITGLDKRNLLATSEYGQTFPSIIQCENIFGVQFHPEKSQKSGLQLLKNFTGIK
jgi:glutamine amidotransferase